MFAFLLLVYMLPLYSPRGFFWIRESRTWVFKIQLALFWIIYTFLSTEQFELSVTELDSIAVWFKSRQGKAKTWQEESQEREKTVEQSKRISSWGPFICIQRL